MASFREDSVPDPKPEKPDLNDVTASEALSYGRFAARLYDFEKSPYELWTEGNLETDPSLGFNLVPDDRTLPGAGISLRKTGEDRRGILSVGNPNLNYSRELVLPEGEGAGREIYDRIEGGIGPFRAHYMKSQFGNQGTGTEYGGDLKLGPFNFFGDRATTEQRAIPGKFLNFFTNPNVDTRRTTFGASGSGDVGIGTLSGGVEQTDRYSDLPQLTGQESRRRVQDPRITRYNLGLKSDDDDKRFVFDIGGGWTDVRGVGEEPARREKDLYGSLKWLDLPFNIPGELGLTWDWGKQTGDKSSAGVGVGWNIENPFGWRGKLRTGIDYRKSYEDPNVGFSYTNQW